MKERITIQNGNIQIPAILFGENRDKITIAVHGDMSNKEDTIIELLAMAVTSKGYSVLSFDLPEHGERKEDNNYECNPTNSISDLQAVYAYAKSLGNVISLFACSIGAYFSLLTFKKTTFEKTLFLSPVVNMERIIQSMMTDFQVSERQLQSENKIALPIGKILDWNYYNYVKQHPINFIWDSPLAILYGSNDILTPLSEIEYFSKKQKANLTIINSAEHYFHSNEHLKAFTTWIEKVL